jgi:hypothetical protein
MYTFDTPLDGTLLHANILCSIRYIEQDTSHEEAKSSREEKNEEKRSWSKPAPAPTPEQNQHASFKLE